MSIEFCMRACLAVSTPLLLLGLFTEVEILQIIGCAFLLIFILMVVVVFVIAAMQAAAEWIGRKS